MTESTVSNYLLLVLMFNSAYLILLNRNFRSRLLFMQTPMGLAVVFSHYDYFWLAHSCLCPTLQHCQPIVWIAVGMSRWLITFMQ